MIGRFFLAVLPLFASSTDEVSSLSMTGEGATAPTGRWYTRGGSSARTGVSESGPDWAKPSRAWEASAPGEIEGEPLCWDSRVVFSSRQGAGVRRLETLDLWTGRATHVPIVVRTPAPLEPSLFGDTVLVRSGERDLTAYHLGGHRPTPVFSWTAPGPISAPLLVESEIYVCSDDGLVRLDLTRREPLWSVAGNFRGTPSLLGDQVFAVRYEGAAAELVAVDRATGAERSSAPAGVHESASPPAGSDLPRMAVTPKDVYVHHAAPVRTSGGEWLNAARVARRANGELRPDGVRLLGLPSEVVPWEGKVVGFFRSERGALFGTSDSDSSTIESWADPDIHAGFLAHTISPSRFDDLCWVGSRAIDLESLRILWKLPGSRGRAVLAGETLLTVRDGRHLEAWRDEDQSAAQRLSQLESQLERQLADEYLELAGDARRARDPQLLRRLLQEARVRGASGPQLAPLDGYADMLEQQRGLRSNADEVAKLAARERTLSRFVVDELWREAQELGAKDPLGTRLVHETLERHPDPSEARAWVRAQLPPELLRGASFDATEWLHFLEAARQSPTRILRSDSRADSSSAWTLFEDALDSWRSDLFGFQSEHLLIASPPTRPGSVARCLSMGEVVCRALESIFEGRPATGALGTTGAPDEPLVLHLFESRGEYLLHSESAGNAGHADLGWTEGHYDPAANLARLYLPEEEGSNLREVFETFAHELTHQWLQNRIGGSVAAERPGFWIVEGFASMIEEFQFDPRTGAWESENPQSHRLDIALNAGGERLDWELVFGASQDEFLRLSPDNTHVVPSSWYLGRRASLSDRSLFYFQAAAAARYLFHAEGGRHRGALLDYVRNYYGGNTGELDVQAAFGASPEALGRGVVAYARSVNG